jgi:hypothetical protein
VGLGPSEVTRIVARPISNGTLHAPLEEGGIAAFLQHFASTTVVPSLLMSGVAMIAIPFAVPRLCRALIGKWREVDGLRTMLVPYCDQRTVEEELLSNLLPMYTLITK